MDNSASRKVTEREACVFLSTYAAWLLGCGATCIRTEKNVRRMAKVLGLDVDISIITSHVHLCVIDRDNGNAHDHMERIRKHAISFDINTQLSRLSWELADGKISFHEARELFERIIQTPPANRWLVLLLVSVANMSFCRLFGGDTIAMGIVFAATMAGYLLKQIMLDDKRDVRLVFFTCAFFSSVIAACGHLFHWGDTPEVALGTSVLYLIPGIPYINSVSDMLDGHYLCSISRLADALVLTACLSTGMCGGILLMGLKLF
mgnify:FL=1